MIESATKWAILLREYFAQAHSWQVNRPAETGVYFMRRGIMASFSRSTTRKAALGIIAAAAVTTGASAADFTQDQCKGIRATAAEVIRTVGKDTLSMQFRQSFVNWLGPDLRCDGPKDILISTHNDSAAYATIRDMLLSGSKPLSLHKAGLRIVVKPADVVSAAPPAVQGKVSAAAPAPTVN